MGFNLADVLAEVSNLDTGREQIEYIRLELIEGDPNNFYQLTDLEQLADNIAMVGLQQPIRLRPVPGQVEKYTIVSGHRRHAAVSLLAKEDPERWHEVACIVEDAAASPALQQLRLIYANSGTRKLTSSELNEQAHQVEKLLYQLKEEGYEFPGRMRDHVAEAVQISKTKLARLKVIRDNLVECWASAYKKDDLGESAAYELAQMKPEDQQLLFDVKQRTGANIKCLHVADISTFAERAEEIEKIICKKDGCTCSNTILKKEKAAKTERYAYNYSCGKCCAKCDHLTSCKNACPKLKEKIKKLKEKAKAERTKEAREKEERERPTIEKIQSFWLRFGCARERSGKTVEEYYKAAQMYYTKADDQKTKDMEGCIPEFSVYTTLPYGYQFHLSYAEKLIAIADLLDVSLDFLFCRTDNPVLAGTGESLDLSWRPGSETPEKNTDAVACFAVEPESSKTIRRIVTWDGSNWCFKNGAAVEVECVKWFPLPADDSGDICNGNN